MSSHMYADQLCFLFLIIGYYYSILENKTAYHVTHPLPCVSVTFFMLITILKHLANVSCLVCGVNDLIELPIHIYIQLYIT